MRASKPASTSRALRPQLTTSAASSVQPPAKTARQPKERLLGLCQQVVAPGDGIAHGALSQGQVAAAAGQHEQALLQTVKQRARGQDADPGRGQLDGQRQPVKAAADRGNGRGVLGAQRERGLIRRCALQEERDGGNIGQFRNR